MDDAITEPYGTLIRFMAWSGLRAGEFTALRTRDIDVLRAEVRVTASVSNVNGQRVRGSTKTNRPRTVMIPRGLAAEVAALMLPDPDAPVFRSPQGRELSINNWRRRHFRSAVHRALPPHLHGFRVHDLRHTCASLLIADGWDIASVSRHVGHKNPVRHSKPSANHSARSGRLSNRRRRGTMQAMNQSRLDSACD